MRRVERVIAEARSLRILRAARAQAPELVPASNIPAKDIWPYDCRVAVRILSDLAERLLPDGSRPPRSDGNPVDGRFGPPLDVLDFSVLAPFLDAVEVAIKKIIIEMDPARLVFESLEPAVLARIHPFGSPSTRTDLAPLVDPPEAEGRKRPKVSAAEAGRARKAALEDVCVLAWEISLLEAVQRIHIRNDLARPFNQHTDFSDFAVEKDVVKRPKKLRAEAARRLAERNFKRVRKVEDEVGKVEDEVRKVEDEVLKVEDEVRKVEDEVLKVDEEVLKVEAGEVA